MTVYSADLLGTYTQYFDSSGCTSAANCQLPVTAPWWGTITARVDASGDGNFTAATLPYLTVNAQFVEFTTNGDGIGNFAGPRPVSVTIQGGVLSGLQIDYWMDQYDHFNASGSNATFDFSGAHRGGSVTASGVIGQDLVSPIPEPSTWALLAGGLLLAGLRKVAKSRPGNAGSCT